MSNKIKFALPGLWTHYQETTWLIDFMEQHPEAIRDNVEIGAVYDNFPYCVWDGGRTFQSLTQASAETIKNISEYFNNKNIPIRLIFTNPVVESHHFYDRFCNLVCAICENELNEIVVNNIELENYLRINYPKYSFISSTTKCNIFDESKKEIELNHYKYICLDYNQNHNYSALESLTNEEKKQIEFLCNAICPPGCPNRKEHYRLNGLFYLNYQKNYYVNCKLNNHTFEPKARNYKNTISPEEIENYYSKQGFSMFKLEGRSLSSFEVILTYAYYLIRPEYEHNFLFYMLEKAKSPLVIDP